MLLDRKYDVNRTATCPRPSCVSPSVDSSFELRRGTKSFIGFPFGSIATAKIKSTAGGSYGYEFRPD
jgi:hypothetical protein